MKNILITGASGGIGRALATAYAETGVNLVLLGRDVGRLKQTAVLCEQQGAQVESIVADVCSNDYEEKMWQLGQKYQFDLVIANAGASLLETFENVDSSSTKKVCDLMKVNFEGQIKTILPLLKGLRQRKGQVVVVSSIAAFRGLPQDPAYSATKAAVSAFFEGCRASWAREGVGVTIVYPGFVKTAMSDKLSSPTPFCVSADKAASIIKKGVTKRKTKIIFPLGLRLLFNSHKLLPAKWVDYLMIKMG